MRSVAESVFERGDEWESVMSKSVDRVLMFRALDPHPVGNQIFTGPASL